jgi:long-chain acyl-CoA synthetase
MFGFRVGFSSGDKMKLVQDIQILRPTVFGSFPVFFDKIYSKIKEKIENSPSLV